jgi:hypothetical protein
MSHNQPKDEAALEGTERPERKVIIEVLGGVAYVASQPDGVEVQIIDYDNEEAEAEQSAPDRFSEDADMSHMSQEGEQWN